MTIHFNSVFIRSEAKLVSLELDAHLSFWFPFSKKVVDKPNELTVKSNHNDVFSVVYCTLKMVFFP